MKLGWLLAAISFVAVSAVVEEECPDTTCGDCWGDAEEYDPDDLTPTKAPVAVPTKAPVAAPTKAPVAAPTKAPVAAPTKAPVAAPTKAPVPAPTKAPVPAPTKAPVPAPTKAPVPAPTPIGNCPTPAEPLDLDDGTPGDGYFVKGSKCDAGTVACATHASENELFEFDESIYEEVQDKLMAGSGYINCTYQFDGEEPGTLHFTVEGSYKLGSGELWGIHIEMIPPFGDVRIYGLSVKSGSSQSNTADEDALIYKTSDGTLFTGGHFYGPPDKQISNIAMCVAKC